MDVKMIWRDWVNDPNQQRYSVLILKFFRCPVFLVEGMSGLLLNNQRTLFFDDFPMVAMLNHDMQKP